MSIARYKGVTIKLIAVLLMTIGVGCSNQEAIEIMDKTEKIVYSTTDTQGETKLVAESEQLELYIDTKTTQINVKNKKNGQDWYSNPQDLENDAIAKGINKSKLQSQIVVTYNNSNGDVVEMNNYDYSISLGQYQLEEAPNGVKVHYTLGKTIPEYNLPQVISEQNFNTLILDKLENPDEKRVIEQTYRELDLDKLEDAKQKEEFLSKYPSLKDGTIYVLRDGQKDFRLQQLSDFLGNVGYTKEMARQEEADNEFNSKKENVSFNVSMSYTLEDEGLVVAVDTDDIEYNEKYPIVDIKILEYFGAANMDAEGYMLIPDASGALINFNNKKNVQTYRSKVYGVDYAMQAREKVENTTQTYMPVFGIKQEEGGFIGIIEEGETVATIEADVSGRINQYNNVCTSFNVLPNQDINLPSLAAMKSIKAYQQRFVEGKLQIRYEFLEKEQADYNGMATAYREYLLKKGLLAKKEIEAVPFVLEILGSIQLEKNIVGIPYKGMQALTTYKQTMSIVQELLEKDIKNIDIKYTGMANKGISHTLPNKIKLESVLGGSKDFKLLQEFMSAHEIGLYPEFDIQYAYHNKLFDNFTSRTDGIRRIDKQLAKKILFNYVTYQQDHDKKPISLVTFDYMDKLTTNLINSLKDKTLQGVSISNVGKDLSSDFNEKLNIDRQQAKGLIEKQLKKINDEDLKMMSSGINIYVLPYVDVITDMPLTCNQYNIIDKEIPFMQLVLHGYVPYTGGAINLAQDYKDTLLKTIETGSGVSFTWIGGDNYLLKGSDYSQYYSVSYKDWIEDAAQFYKEMNEALGDTYNQVIVKHEEIQNNVYQVEYEKGKKVVINYNEYEVKVGSEVIASKDYHVIGGDSK